jgi:glutamate racemase
VLATTATLKQKKLHQLVERLGNPEWLLPFPCPGLVELIEQGHLQDSVLEDYLAKTFESLRDQDVQAVVLGCTHYLFVRKAIRGCFGAAVPIIDGNAGTAAHLARVLRERDLLRQTAEERRGRVEFITTGDEEMLGPVFQRLMEVAY